MKLSLNFMDKKRILAGISVVVLLMGILISSAAFAISKPTIVYFYANWNQKCREMTPLIESITASYGNRVALQKLDIDQSNAADVAASLNLRIPRSVPYIVILDRNGRIVSAIPNAGQSPQQLRAEIDALIRPQL